MRRLILAAAVILGAGLAVTPAASAAPTAPAHRTIYLNENLGFVAATYFDPLLFDWFYYSTHDAFYVNVNVLSQGLYPVVYFESWDHHSDTNFNWVNVTGNWYHLVDPNGNCVAFAASTPNTPLVMDTCQTVSWEEFYWGGCHQSIFLRYNNLRVWYQGATDTPAGLISPNGTPMAWTSGYAGCATLG